MFARGGAGVGDPTGRDPHGREPADRGLLAAARQALPAPGEAPAGKVLSDREGPVFEAAAGLVRVARRLRVQPEARGGAEGPEVAEARGRVAQSFGAERLPRGARVHLAAAQTLEEASPSSARRVHALDEEPPGEVGDTTSSTGTR